MLLANDKSIDELPLPPIVTSDRHSAGQWSAMCGLVIAIFDCMALLLAVKVSQVLLKPMAGHVHTAGIGSDGPDLLYLAIGAYFFLKGRYTERTPFWQETYLIVRAVLCALCCEAGLAVLNGDYISRLPVLVTLAIFPALAISANRLAKLLLERAGIWTIPVVVVGKRENVAQAEKVLKSDRSLGYEIVGRLDPSFVMSSPGFPRLKPVLAEYRACSLVIAADWADTLHHQIVACALQERVPFATMMQPFPAPTFSSKSTCFFSEDAMLLSFQDRLSRPIPRFAKAATDVLIAFVLLVMAAPAMLIISAINLSSGGPVLFRQLRVGAGGRTFYCLKFRTMVVDADRVLQEELAKDPKLALEWETQRKLKKDPRVTPFGQFLRKTSLDELPQLFNVLRRDMSLVGPRPIVASEVPLYGDNIAQYYATRPGLTGLWQVSGRSNTTYARRVQLDVWYVNNWTFWHDIAVLLKTIPAVLNRNGAH
jgi:Undecaprenyl-phosphate galactose phosphotransferase WbaP